MLTRRKDDWIVKPKCICISVSATIFQKISKAATLKETWDILTNVYGNYEKIKKVKLQSLQRQYDMN